MSFLPNISITSLVRVLPVIATIGAAGCGLELPSTAPASMERFDLSSVPSIGFPDRPESHFITDNVDEYIVKLPVPADQPGHASDIRVLIPRNDATRSTPNQKIPALIFNGAGAYLFSGMNLTDDDMDPMIAYAQAGFAVIGYATDGCQPNLDREPTKEEIAIMVRAYVASKAGLINATRALDFSLATFPEIDPNEVYSIGHSSGAKQALLFAQHDDRIRGCVAFAPACQMDYSSSVVVARIDGPDADFLLEEVKRSMPIVHAQHSTKPTMLVCSPSDRVVRKSEVMAMAHAVSDDLGVFEVDCDSHGDVPEAGFQESLNWLSAQINPANASEETVVGNAIDSPVTIPAAVATATPIQSNPIPTVSPTAAAAEAERNKQQQEMLRRAGIQANPFLTGN